MPRTLFADAFYWIALVSPRDEHHAAALSISRSMESARVVTTEEVLNEFLTHFCQSGAYWRAKVAAFVREVRCDQRIKVLPQTSDSFEMALALYEQRLDKGYSLTDCRSMVAMRSLGISEVLSNDHHFGQEGFTVLFL
jgi:uncharacterized protein